MILKSDGSIEEPEEKLVKQDVIQQFGLLVRAARSPGGMLRLAPHGHKLTGTPAPGPLLPASLETFAPWTLTCSTSGRR